MNHSDSSRCVPSRSPIDPPSTKASMKTNPLLTVRQVFDTTQSILAAKLELDFLARIMSKCSTRPEVCALVREFCGDHGISLSAALDRLEGV